MQGRFLANKPLAPDWGFQQAADIEPDFCFLLINAALQEEMVQQNLVLKK